MSTICAPIAAAPAKRAALPKWSIGSATMTLFKDGDPTGTELVVHNLRGGDPRDLIDQANAAAALLPMVVDLVATLRAISADPLLLVGEACLKFPNLVGTTLYATDRAVAKVTKGQP